MRSGKDTLKAAMASYKASKVAMCAEFGTGYDLAPIVEMHFEDGTDMPILVPSGREEVVHAFALARSWKPGVALRHVAFVTDAWAAAVSGEQAAEMRRGDLGKRFKMGDPSVVECIEGVCIDGEGRTLACTTRYAYDDQGVPRFTDGRIEECEDRGAVTQILRAGLWTTNRAARS